MTKKHFIEVAKMISCLASDDEREKLSLWFATWFAKYNPLFDRAKFIEACWHKDN